VLFKRKKVLSCLKSASKPLNLAELAAQFKCDPGILEPLLQEMETRGQVIRTRKNRYGIPEKMNLFVGTIQGHPKVMPFSFLMWKGTISLLVGKTWVAPCTMIALL